MQNLIVEKKDGIGRIVFNQPETKNALTSAMLDETMRAITAFERDDDVRVLLFSGAGGAFTSGGDLKFLADMTEKKPFEIRNTVCTYFAGTGKAIKLCRKPTVAAVAGPAVGTGCEYAIACDFRVAGESAAFCETGVNIGSMAPLGGLFLLPRLIGLGRATDMLLRGTTVGGAEAECIGLVNSCVPDAQLESAPLELARELAEGPPLAQSALKEVLRRGMESSLYAEWEFDPYAQAMLINTDDYAEAARAQGKAQAAGPPATDPRAAAGQRPVGAAGRAERARGAEDLRPRAGDEVRRDRPLSSTGRAGRQRALDGAVLMNAQPAELNSLLARHVAERPQATALVDSERRWSYAEFDGLCARTAAWLAVQGIGPGDRVAVWLVNRVEWLALLFALARRGAAMMSVNTRFREAELAHVLERSQARLLVIQRRFRRIDFDAILDTMDGAHFVRLERVAVLDAGAGLPALVLGKPTLAFDADALPPADAPAAHVSSPDAPLIFFTTSGTTSGSKLVVHAQPHLALNARDVARALGFEGAGHGALGAVPFCGTFGLFAALASLAAGAPLVLMQAFDAAGAAALVRRHALTHMFGTDDMLRRMLGLDEATAAKQSLKLAGFVLNEEMARRALARGCSAAAGPAAPRPRCACAMWSRASCCLRGPAANSRSARRRASSVTSTTRRPPRR